MPWVRFRVRVKVTVTVTVRVSVSCAFSEAFVGIAAVGIAACSRVNREYLVSWCTVLAGPSGDRYNSIRN